jgi:hypothetical protein
VRKQLLIQEHLACPTVSVARPTQAHSHAGGQGDHYTPKPFVRQAFRKYLECGIFAHGFARAWCDDCGHDYFMAYSCKGRRLIEKADAKEMLAYQHSGFSVDAGVRIEADDRAALERLLRYCAHPPFAMERLRKEGAALVYRCAKQ